MVKESRLKPEVTMHIHIVVMPAGRPAASSLGLRHDGGEGWGFHKA